MSELQRTPTGNFHPGYGCAIMFIMVLTFSGIVTWVVYSLLRQHREIAAFTTEQAAPMPGLAVTDADKLAVRHKLSSFAEAAGKGEAAQLSLDAGECNTLLSLATDAGIGGDKDSTPYPDILRFAGFEAQARLLKTDIRLPMNKLPWQEGKRYLVGSATFRPDIEKGSFVVRVEDVTVPGKAVPEGFVRNLKIWDWLDVAKKKDARIADTFKKITSWRIEGSGSALVLECSKAATASEVKPRE